VHHHVDREATLGLLRERKSAGLSNMRDSDLQRLCDRVSGVRYNAGDKLGVLGEVPDFMYIVVEGEVLVKDEKGATVNTAGPSAVIGEGSLFADTPLEFHFTAGKQGAIVVQASFRNLEMTKTLEFIDDVVEQHKALVRFAESLKTPYHPDYSSLSGFQIPPWETWSLSKSGRYHALISQYRRLKGLAVQARIGRGHRFFSLEAPEAVKGMRENLITFREGGLVAETGRRGGWSFAQIAQELPSAGQTYLEFTIEQQGGSLCEMLFGVYDAAKAPKELAWRHPEAWMYYCVTGRIYRGGFGYDFSTNRQEAVKAKQGDTVGILVHQVEGGVSSSHPQGSTASLYVSGKCQGIFVSQKSLEKNGHHWPQKMGVCIDVHGTTQQRIRFNVESTRTIPPGGPPFAHPATESEM